MVACRKSVKEAARVGPTCGESGITRGSGLDDVSCLRLPGWWEASLRSRKKPRRRDETFGASARFQHISGLPYGGMGKARSYAAQS